MEAPVREWVDLIDFDNRVLGRAPRTKVRARNLLHRGVGILVVNSAHQVYVHRRTDRKDVFPGLFDMFVGGGSRAVRRSKRPRHERSLRSLASPRRILWSASSGTSTTEH